MAKITKAWIEKMQSHLLDYVKEWSDINRNQKFQCFNNILEASSLPSSISGRCSA